MNTPNRSRFWRVPSKLHLAVKGFGHDCSDGTAIDSIQNDNGGTMGFRSGSNSYHCVGLVALAGAAILQRWGHGNVHDFVEGGLLGMAIVLFFAGVGRGSRCAHPALGRTEVSSLGASLPEPAIFLDSLPFQSDRLRRFTHNSRPSIPSARFDLRRFLANTSPRSEHRLRRVCAAAR